MSAGRRRPATRGAIFLSIFDVFKVGIDQSSSHTMGAMASAGAFVALLAERLGLEPPSKGRLHIRVTLQRPRDVKLFGVRGVT